MEEESWLVKEPPGLEGCTKLKRGPRLGWEHDLGREKRPAPKGGRGSRRGPCWKIGRRQRRGLR